MLRKLRRKAKPVEPKIAAHYPYRCPWCAGAGHCDLHCADDLERVIQAEGEDRVIAFIAEPIVGSSAPGTAGDAAYWRRIREICDRHQVAFIADEVTRRGWAEVISEPGNLPVLCARLPDESAFNAHDVARVLRRKGWIVPAYTMPPDLEEMSILRVVVREGFSRDMAVALLDDLHDALEALHLDPPPSPAPHRPSKQRVC